MGRKFLKCILKYLFYTKYNEINIFHSVVQKHFSNEKWLKEYKYFEYKLTQKFSDTVWTTEGNFLKRISAYVYCTK